MTPITSSFSFVQSTKRILAVACVAVAATTYAGPPSLVQNGSFEDPNLPVGGFLFQTDGTGWSSAWVDAGGPGVWDNSYLSFIHPPAIDGHQALWMPSGTSVWQTVSLQAGTFYNLSFYTTPQLFSSVLPSITLTLTDSTNFTPINVSWGTSNPGSWSLSSVGFTPLTTDNYTLKFTLEDTLAENAGFGVAFLDDVTLTAGTTRQVPDGGSTAVFSLIGLLLVFRARRRLA